MPACSSMSSVIVARRHGGVRSRSRSRYAQLRAAAQLGGGVGDELLGELHDVAVVGVGLVELEHRELGVPPVAEPFVAEHPADLEHLLEAADDEPLEVQLGRDPQVHVHVERVVVGDERLGVRAAGDRVEDRRLDLDEPAVFEPAAHERHEPAAELEACGVRRR